MAENINFDKLNKTLRESTEGLKDQVSYMKELGDLKNRYNRELAKGEKLEERVKDTLEDIVDKTKDVFKNRKSIHEETLTTVDLHKLERRLIAEGLDDQIKIVQKLKEEHNVQKQINRVVNQQVKMYSNIGSSIDSMIRSIPGGGFLGDLLGTDTLAKDMGEEFRTSLQSGGLGGFFKDMGAEASGGFLNNLFSLGGGGVGGAGDVGKARKRLNQFVFGGGAMLAATTVLFAKGVQLGMRDGLESVGLRNTIKRFFFGGAFDGLREAFGNLGQADRSTLFSMRMNKFRFGIDEKDQAKILAAQINISGATKDTALNIQSGIAKSAAMRGVLPADVFQDIANNTEQFATFAKDGGQNIGEAAIRARELGISLDTVFKISDSILDFQSSIENELKASLLIGRQLNLNEARRLAMAGDQAGLQEEILRQVGSEEELQRMNAIQRKSLAGALGVTVSELNRLASGELEVKNADMKQNTNAVRNLTFVMGALAMVQGGRLAKRGLGFLFSGRERASAGVAEVAKRNGRIGIVNPETGRFFAGRSGYANTASANNAMKTMGLASRATATRIGLGAVGGPATAIAVGLSVIIPLVRKLVDSSDDTAKNTKRSITDQNFITSPLMSATPVKGNG